MLRAVLIVILLNIISNHIKAQTINGTIFNNNGPVEGAIIRNSHSGILKVSDRGGRFHINASPGDIISGSYIGYKTDSVVLRNQPNLNLYLRATSNSLKEVFITGRHLTPLEKFKMNQQEFKEIYHIGDDTHMFSINGGAGRAGIGISIDALYSAFSKEGKDARTLQRVLINDYHTDEVNDRYSKELVAKITGYQGKQLEDFMIANQPSFEFMKNATDYDLIQFIRRRINGIVLITDNPVEKKHNADGGFKIKFKMPETPVTKRENIGADFRPGIHP